MEQNKNSISNNSESSDEEPEIRIPKFDGDYNEVETVPADVLTRYWE